VRTFRIWSVFGAAGRAPVGVTRTRPEDPRPRAGVEINIRPPRVSLNPGWQRPPGRGKLPRWISP